MIPNVLRISKIKKKHDIHIHMLLLGLNVWAHHDLYVYIDYWGPSAIKNIALGLIYNSTIMNENFKDVKNIDLRSYFLKYISWWRIQPLA